MQGEEEALLDLNKKISERGCAFICGNGFSINFDKEFGNIYENLYSAQKDLIYNSHFKVKSNKAFSKKCNENYKSVLRHLRYFSEGKLLTIFEDAVLFAESIKANNQLIDEFWKRGVISKLTFGFSELEQHDIELRKKEEEQARQKALEEERQAKLREEDEEFERQWAERERKASLRPVEIDPNRWKKRYWTYSDQPTYKRTTRVEYETTEEKIEKQKKEKVRKQLLSHPIEGEVYIDGDKKFWRLVILTWIKENQERDSLSVSLQNLLTHMKNSGVTFNQHEKLVQYPVITFLEYYEKVMKSELKKKVYLNIVQ